MQLREYKEIYKYEQYKDALESQKENSRAEQGALNDWVSDCLPMIHSTATHLWSATERIYML